jgi:WD40 repeat protein
VGLIKLWIYQGATGAVSAAREVKFQPLPPGIAPIFAVAVTPDGQFAACSRGKQIHIYHLPSRQFVAQLTDGEGQAAHTDIIRSLAFDPSGERLASGAYREVKVWRAPHVGHLAEVKFDAAITAIGTTAHKDWAALGDDKGRVRLIEQKTGNALWQQDAHTTAVTGVAFADDKTLLTASRDKTVRLWNPTDGKPQATLITPSEINALAVIHEGQWLVTAHEDGALRVWDRAAVLQNSESVEPLREMKASGRPITALAAWPGEIDEIVAGGADGVARRYNAATGEERRSWNHEAPIVALAVRGDGLRLASAGGDRTRLWSADSGERVAQLQGDPRTSAEVARIDGEIAFLKSAIQLAKNDIKSYEGTERRVMTTAEAVTKAETDSLAKAEKTLSEKMAALEKAKADGKDEKQIEKATKELAEAETARSVALTIIERAKIVAQRAVKDFEDAKVAVAAKESALTELENQKNSANEAIAAAIKPVADVAFTPDQQRLIVLGDQGLYTHHDATTGQALAANVANESPRVLSLSATGLQFTANNAGVVHIDRVVNEWTLERTIGGASQPTALSDRVLALDFNHDGSLLATGGGLPSRAGELRVFRVADGSLAHEIQDAHADTVLGVRFSPDGKHLASGGADRFVRVFRIPDGELAQTFGGHTAHVQSVDWSRDGQYLVSCGGERVLKLWDFTAGRPVFTMKGSTYKIGPYRGEVTSAVFIGGSEQILAASGDGTVRLHRTSSDNDILTFADPNPKTYFYAVAASDDGRALVAGGADGVLRVWSGQERSPVVSFSPPSAAPR